MKTTLFFAVLLILAIQQSCVDEKSNTDNNPNILWKASLTPSKTISAAMDADIQYKGGVLLGGMDESGRCLHLVDIENGKTRWKWNDFLPTDLGWLVRWPAQNDNKVLIVDGRNMYCIDLENGQTQWKRKFTSGYSSIARNLDSKYIIPARIYNLPGEDVGEGKVISGNFIDGSGESVIITPKYSRSFVDSNLSRGEILSCDPISIGGDQGLLIFFGDPLPDYHINHFIGLYNLTKEKWEYDKAPFVLNVRAYAQLPIIKDNKVYNSVNKTIQCHDLSTGNIIWTQTLSDVNTGFNGWVADKLIVTTQDRITHCIDPATGKELWALTTSGNPGIVRELNGIAYFVGGNAKLFAIDVAAGKILWQFSSPDEQINSKAFWQEGVRVVLGANGQKGKVIVSSYLNGYCYEAIR